MYQYKKTKSLLYVDQDSENQAWNIKFICVSERIMTSYGARPLTYIPLQPHSPILWKGQQGCIVSCYLAGGAKRIKTKTETAASMKKTDRERFSWQDVDHSNDSSNKSFRVFKCEVSSFVFWSQMWPCLWKIRTAMPVGHKCQQCGRSVWSEDRCWMWWRIEGGSAGSRQHPYSRNHKLSAKS